YRMSCFIIDGNIEAENIEVTTAFGYDQSGNIQQQSNHPGVYAVDTKNPAIQQAVCSQSVLSDNDAGAFHIDVIFDDAMNTALMPGVSISGSSDLTNSISANGSTWLDDSTLRVNYLLQDANEEIGNLSIALVDALDHNGNAVSLASANNIASIDTRNPEIVLVSSNTYDLNPLNAGAEAFQINIVYNESMHAGSQPSISFPNEATSATFNANASGWMSSTVYRAVYDFAAPTVSIQNIDIAISDEATDAAGNLGESTTIADYFSESATSSVNETDQSTFNIYPNPVLAGSPVSMVWEGSNTPSILHVYDAQGRSVLNSMISAGTQRLYINTNDWSEGLYFIHLESDEHALRSSLMVVSKEEKNTSRKAIPWRLSRDFFISFATCPSKKHPSLFPNT
ncbi:MAG: T9SS type A sorting domain-containing protein, partial [Flavobacteriales bacterium]